MSKSLRSYHRSQRIEVITRRLKQGENGLGYWAAVAAIQHHRRTPNRSDLQIENQGVEALLKQLEK
jgi:hypothetical protein